MQLLIVFKRSKWERDLAAAGSEEKIRFLYDIQNQAAERIYKSHLRQQEAFCALKKALPEATFISRQQLAEKGAAGFDLVASLGGDNHFVFVSRYANKTPLAGINSDPETSSGSLLYFTPATFLEALAQWPLLEMEGWTRLQGRIEYASGKSVVLPGAISEISIRSAFNEHVSRYLIRFPESARLIDQKSSGMLLATGTGSTGWFSNAGGKSFARTAPFFQYIVREPHFSAVEHYYGTIQEAQELEIISEMEGLINIDAQEELCYEFPPASRAIFSLADQPLLAILPP